MTDHERYVDSPVGFLYLAATDEGLTHLLFTHERKRADPSALRPGNPDARQPAREILDAATRQLEAYFAGRCREFDLPLAPRGTAFQLSTWNALREIPYGATISYRELARRIGKPNAVRAVGAANGRNPLAIVMPCHRVIGSNGRLTGYAGGLEIKRTLLELEGVLLPGLARAQTETS
jgi:methylated-DNA-[protein]-cysteine S-methyltransferase